MFGTFTIADLQSQQVPVVQFGEENAFQAISDALEVHNRITEDIMGDLVLTTTDNLRRYGGPNSMVMLPVDQFGVVPAQKVTQGTNIGFPLTGYQIVLQWSKWALQKMSTVELAAQTIAAQDADIKNLQLLIKQAVYTPTDYTFTDTLGDGLLLPIRPFLNADGEAIPLGPNGEIFNPSTHTHYLGVATTNAPTLAEVKGLVETVIEHYATGQPKLYLNRAQQAYFTTTFGPTGTGDFFPYYDNRVTVATTISRGDGALNPIALYNRPIGIFDGAEVWIKPWSQAGYMFAFLDNGLKPLVQRVPPMGATGLQLMSEVDIYPLRSELMQRVVGVSAYNRPNGAVLDVSTGSSTYTTPTVSVV